MMFFLRSDQVIIFVNLDCTLLRSCVVVTESGVPNVTAAYSRKLTNTVFIVM